MKCYKSKNDKKYCKNFSMFTDRVIINKKNLTKGEMYSLWSYLFVLKIKNVKVKFNILNKVFIK